MTRARVPAFCFCRMKWIDARLRMGTWTYVSNLLNQPSETQPQAQEELPLCQL